MKNKFPEIVESQSSRLYNYIFKIMGDREESFDLTQDTFLKVWQKYSHLTDSNLIKKYLYKAAYHLSINRLRDKKRHSELNEEITGKQNDHDFSIHEKKQRERQIQNQMLQLSEKQARVISFRFFARMTIPEIAVTMNVSEGTVKTHLARGLNNLKRTLAPNNIKE